MVQRLAHAALTLLYNFNLCCAEVMALRTDNRFTRDLMLDAVPYSSPSIFWTRDTCARACAVRLASMANEALVAHK